VGFENVSFGGIVRIFIDSSGNKHIS
jgi:hypothetical protein